MSFDLYFCRENNSIPSIAELKEYFSMASPFFKVNDPDAGGVEVWYHNEATGVYCSFSYSPLDAQELEGFGSSGLSFNLNYLRPSFFAYETMPLVEAFCKRFDLLVEDSQEETVHHGNAEQLIASWCAHNTSATRMMMVQKEEDIELDYFPEQRATEWWRYMSVKEAIQTAVGEDIFVPALWLLMDADKRLFTMILWSKGIPQFFPPCDYVYVEREKKRLFRTKEEAGVVRYESVLKTLEPVLDDYVFGGFQLKYLRPENEEKVSSVVQTLDLAPIDLPVHNRVASDGFHDVPVAEESA